jgi:hypothetical protein
VEVSVKCLPYTAMVISSAFSKDVITIPLFSLVVSDISAVTQFKLQEREKFVSAINSTFH